MQRILRMTQSGANARVFTDPANFKHTFGEKLNVQQKAAGDARIYNARSEFVTSDVVTVAAEGACTDPCVVGARTEVITIRTIVSGSVENKTKLEQLIIDHNRNVEIALPDHLTGFMAPLDVEFVVEYDATP